MIVQPAFGQRVKQLRRQLGLPQAEVAGTEMSASYISLVESGRRTPSDEMARIIARRLGVEVAELAAPPDPPVRPGRRMNLASRLVAAGSVRAGGDLDSARSLAEALVADIDSPDDDDLSWEARWLLAEILAQQHDFARYDGALEQLRTHPFTADSPELLTRVAAATAEHARQRGRLEACVATAETALVVAEGLPVTAPERLQLETTLLAAFAMGEEVRQAEPLAAHLMEVLPDVATRFARSNILWTTAAVRFLGGVPGAAAELIEQALAEVTPAADLARWAALCRSAAAIRLGGDGGLDPVWERLRRSRQAFELIGAPVDLAELAGLEALAHLKDANPDAAVQSIDSAPADLGDASPVRRAGVCIAVGRARAGAGQQGQALAAYRQAAELYEESGMYKSAVRVWRELNGVVEAGTSIEPAMAGWPAVMLP
ncbi:helix-turn-helix domain-containing protein [Krasilnikovia sp. M28-CT-15]|uniref:helix-turn-helix domain-containing protein n=1 Tax=Krasilnikovia sp. M28-CT-15 TaxID=3373540 RepID=UPI003875D664